MLAKLNRSATVWHEAWRKIGTALPRDTIVHFWLGGGEGMNDMVGVGIVGAGAAAKVGVGAAAAAAAVANASTPLVGPSPPFVEEGGGESGCCCDGMLPGTAAVSVNPESEVR